VLAGGGKKTGIFPGFLALVRSSFAFAIAVHRESGATVGMGRAISDGVSDAYIQDLIVLPDIGAWVSGGCCSRG